MSPIVWKTIMFISMVVLAIGLVCEVNNWRTGRRIISRKQQVIRLATGILLIVLFGLMIVGTTVTDTSNPFAFMLYWMGCFVLGCSVVLLMLLDLREVGERYREQHREMLKRISEEAKRK